MAVCFLFLVLLIVFGKSSGRLDTVQPLPEGLEGTEITLQGTLYKRETRSEKKLLYLKNISFLFENSEYLTYSANAIVYTKEKECRAACRIGSRIRVKGICYAPQAASNPGQFDQEAYYHGQKVGMLLQKAEVLGESGGYEKGRELLASLRENLKAGLLGALSRLGETEDTGVLAAMLLGEKGLLEEDTEKLYQTGGISHILAISGLHISMTGMALYSLLRLLLGGFALPAGISGLLMAFYGWFTGGSPSATRAVVMFHVFLGAQVWGREYDRLSALAFGGIVLLLREPLQLFQCGFQLTMLSAAGAEAYLTLAAGWKGGRAGGKLLQAAGPGLVIQAFTLPCILYWFSEIPLYGSLLNLAVLPLMPAVLFSGAAGMAAACFSGAAGAFLLAPAHYILKLYELLCACAGALPCSRLVCGAPEMAELVLYAAGLLLLLAGGGKLRRQKGERKSCSGAGRGRFFRVSGWLALTVGLLGLFWPALTNGGSLSGEVLRTLQGGSPELSMTFLDVGQGDSIFIRSPEGVTWLIDGGSSTESAVGTYRILPFLKHQGIRRLDYLILTHMDADHINGVREILEKPPEGISIGNLLMSPDALEDARGQELLALAGQSGIPVGVLYRGKSFRCGSLQIDCLWPKKESAFREKNENSLVFQVSYGAFRALLTGDLEGEAEKALLETGELEQVWLLKAGHHGSKGATSGEFLQVLRPEAAILSYGKGNRYGHPGPETLERLEQAGVQAFGTAEWGAVTAVSDGAKVTLQCYRRRREA